MDYRKLLVWVRVPLMALDRAVNALKERAMLSHHLDKREEAASDEQAANDITESLDKNHTGPPH